MLHLLDGHLAHVGSFHNYSEIVQYIHNSQIYHLVHKNVLDDPLMQSLDLEELCWRFVYYKHSELSIIYSCMKEPPIMGVEKEAFDQGLDLIEIHHGSSLNPMQLPVTADLDIDLLKREWCEAYCSSQGFKIISSISSEQLSGPLTEGGF
jgi:hypothetical protein